MQPRPQFAPPPPPQQQLGGGYRGAPLPPPRGAVAPPPPHAAAAAAAPGVAYGSAAAPPPRGMPHHQQPLPRGGVPPPAASYQPQQQSFRPASIPAQPNFSLQTPTTTNNRPPLQQQQPYPGQYPPRPLVQQQQQPRPPSPRLQPAQLQQQPRGGFPPPIQQQMPRPPSPRMQPAQLQQQPRGGPLAPPLHMPPPASSSSSFPPRGGGAPPPQQQQQLAPRLPAMNGHAPPQHYANGPAPPPPRGGVSPAIANQQLPPQAGGGAFFPPRGGGAPRPPSPSSSMLGGAAARGPPPPGGGGHFFQPGPPGVAPARGPPPPQQFAGRGPPPPSSLGGIPQFAAPPPPSQQQQHYPQHPQQQHVAAAAAPPPSIRPNMDFPPVSSSGVINSLQYDLPRDGGRFVCADTGNASYRYMRPTCRFMPCTSSALSEIKLPLAVLAQPFADPASPEESVHVSEWANNDTGPVRCTRCRGYINCFAVITREYTKWECALCQHVNDLAVSYRGFAQSGNCAELQFGSVEFDVNESFFSADQRKPQLDVLFLLDAGQAALRTGLFSYALHSVATRCRSGGAGFPAGSRVAIVTYDENGVHFYLVPTESSGNRKVRVLVCGDVDEGFSPVPSDAVLVDAASPQADELVQFVSGRFAVDATQANTGSIGGAALASAVACLARGAGGRVVWLSSQLPTRGQGKLQEREVPAVIGHAVKEQLLYIAPGEESLYNLAATLCLQHNISLDVAACGAPFMDLAALVQVTSTTGGQLERIPGFTASNAVHRQQLDGFLARVAQGTRALGVSMKARVSTGLTVKRILGHGFVDESSYRISSLSNEYCCAIELEHDGTKLADQQRVICQLAVLYTSPQPGGARKLRVHNFALTAREQGVTGRQFDALSVCNVWAKQCSLLLAEMTVDKTREQLLKRLAQGLPDKEAKSTWTTYCNALIKSPALVLNKPLDQRTVREPFAFADARIVSRFRLLDASNDRLLLGLYPTVLDLTAADATPRRVPSGSEHLRAEGIYLLYDGLARDFDVFVGSRANPALVEQFVGQQQQQRAVIVCSLKNAQDGTPQQLLLARTCRLLAAGDAVTCVRVNFASHADFFAEAKPVLLKLVEDKIFAEQSLAGFMSHVSQLASSSSSSKSSLLG